MATPSDRSQTERGFVTTTTQSAQAQPVAEGRNEPTRLKAFQLVRNSVYTLGVLFFIAIAGAVVVGLTGSDASTISVMLTAVTGVIGSLVGAYFGVQVGNEGRQQVEERAEERRREAEDRLNKALGMLPREDAALVLGMELPTSEPTEQEPE